MAFPRTGATGKNSKVYLNTGDGQLISLEEMTKQASYTYNGEAYTDQVYLLGTGMTLINMRAEKEPNVYVAGIVDGMEVTGTSTIEDVAVSAGTLIDADGTSVSVAADASLTVTRPAASEFAWVAISVNMSTGAFTATKGTDTTTADIDDLLATYGTGAGQRPYIPTTDLLVSLLKLDSTSGVVVSSDIKYYDREYDSVEAFVLPNIGGALLSEALVACHTGGVARTVKFTGYYLDNVMALVGTAKSWGITPSANEVTESTFFQNMAASEIGGYGFTFEQLMTDNKAWENTVSRQGYGAIKLEVSNGHSWQSAATMVATLNSAA
jgi:hypothetical protein